ncbi:MAG: nucleotidyl transferase AbiEii/AbiGii toxin family protein [bacterium]|nr:nucleotidyl transferase AbiEii/AbiGii toxin family protein [bacterium]
MVKPTFNTALHKNVMFQILKAIYFDTTVASLLGFKGGTAALMFYELDRFSVDLDFDLLDRDKEDFVFERIEQVAKKYGKIKDAQKKRFNLLFVLSYEDKARQIKLEINRRAFGSHYDVRNYLGVSVPVMVKEDMFAHKLMAMRERIGKTSRDIYDVWFFLEHRWPINKEIVEQRAGVPFKKLIEQCIEKLEKMNNRDILGGLGELLTEPQKDWARAKLREETIFQLKARLESEK